MSIITRTEAVSDGLRSKLFGVIDALLKDEIELDKVEAICAVSDQIIKSAKVELEIRKEHEEIERRKSDRIKEVVGKLDNIVAIDGVIND